MVGPHNRLLYVRLCIRKEADDILEIIRHEEFVNGIFVSWIYGTENCESIESKWCKEIVEDDGFCHMPMRTECMEGTKVANMYWKDILQVPRKQGDM